MLHSESGHRGEEDSNSLTILSQLRNPTTMRKAFGWVVRQYSEPMYWKIRRIVISHDDANDVLQNALLKAWNNIDTFKGESKLSTWLYRIAINESLDFVRHRKALTLVDGDAELASLQSDKYFDGNDAERLLQEAVATLPDVQRTVFTMRYFEDMKYSDISDILDTSEGALKASYHIAVKKISEYFKSRD